MVQPGIAELLVSDPILKRQGLTSRFLMAAPASRIGSRMQRVPRAQSKKALERFEAALLKLLRMKQPRAGPCNPELRPRQIKLSGSARKLWEQFADECERELGPNGAYEPIQAFASKLGEHALRLAAVLQVLEKPTSTQVSAATFRRAANLARYYAKEAIRLDGQGTVSLEIQNAEKVLNWLREGWPESKVGLAHVYQFGPYAIREAALAREAMTILEKHHWVERIEGGAMIKGKRCRIAWHVYRG